MTQWGFPIMRRHLSALLLFLSAMIAAPAAAQERGDVIIRHATVVDVANERLVPRRAIVVSGDKIVAIGDDAQIADAWRAPQTVDATGKFVIPALWDMHVHFGGGPELLAENQALLPLYVAHGITAVRDASGDIPQEVLAMRTAVADGTLFGPRIFTSGPKIEGINPVWRGTLESGTREDVDRNIAQLRTLQVDFVKITDSTLQPDLFLYAVHQARAAGFRTSGHIPMALTLRQAVDAGLSSVEHLDYAFTAGAAGGDRIVADFAAGRIDRATATARLHAAFDPETAMAMYRYLAERNIYVTPTLNGSRIIAYLDRDTHANDPYLAFIGPRLRATYQWRIDRAATATPEQVAQRHARIDQIGSILPMLQQAGVTIMAGTDAGFLNSFNYPGIGLHQELQIFVDNGLTPAQALSAATRAGPAWFGLSDLYGSIDTGKMADIVLLDANPLTDIAATRTINTVIMRGHVYDRAALDQMLDGVRRQVATWNAAATATE